MVKQAIMNPMKRLPASPMKILAGLKLYTRNPRRDPRYTELVIRTKPGALLVCAFRKCVRKTKPPAIKAIPADNPSMLSRRLKALGIPTIQIMEKKRLRAMEVVQFNRKPK